LGWILVPSPHLEISPSNGHQIPVAVKEQRAPFIQRQLGFDIIVGPAKGIVLGPMHWGVAEQLEICNFKNYL
jgi:hypothetical protein